MKQYLIRLLKLVRYGETEGIELLCGALSLAWGLWVLLPFESFRNPAYSAMSSVAPEWIWGAYYAALGALCWWGVLAERHGIRAWTSRAISISWFFMAAMYIRSSVSLPSTLVCPTVALFAAFVHIRLWSTAHPRVRRSH